MLALRVAAPRGPGVVAASGAAATAGLSRGARRGAEEGALTLCRVSGLGGMSEHLLGYGLGGTF